MEDLILNERKFRNDLANLVNNSNLPAFIIKPIVQELLQQIGALEEQQYNEALNIKEEQTKENQNKKVKKGGK